MEMYQESQGIKKHTKLEFELLSILEGDFNE